MKQIGQEEPAITMKLNTGEEPTEIFFLKKVLFSPLFINMRKKKVKQRGWDESAMIIKN